MPTTKAKKSAKRKTPAKRPPREPRSAKPQSPKARKPAVLPKSDGPAGVRAFIASMEPWQAAIARRVDVLLVENVPGLRKAVRWRCPFYGVDGQGWFLAFAAFQRHVKFTFFLGTSLKPVPPVGGQPHARSLDVREGDKLDEKQFVRWIKQAASMPGWDGGSPRSYGGVAL